MTRPLSGPWFKDADGNADDGNTADGEEKKKKKKKIVIIG
jgi:hypothetical protein